MKKAAALLALLLAGPALGQPWGTLSWSAVNAASGGSPGGATTQIQYNDAGSFAGSAALVYAKATGAVGLTQQAVGTVPLAITGIANQTGSLLTLTGGATPGNAFTSLVSLTGTMPANPSAPPYMVNLDVTGAGNGSAAQTVLRANIAAGYTGAGGSRAIAASNASGTTGTYYWQQPWGVYGGVTGGSGYGVIGSTSTTNGTGTSGVIGMAGGITTNGQFGVLGTTITGGAIPAKTAGIGGWLRPSDGSLVGLAPTETTASYFDNGAAPNAIIIAADASVPKFYVGDGGTTRFAADAPIVFSTTTMATDTADVSLQRYTTNWLRVGDGSTGWGALGTATYYVYSGSTRKGQWGTTELSIASDVAFSFQNSTNFGAASDVFLRRNGAAGAVLWGTVAASPQAYVHTLSSPAVGTDIAGSGATVQPGYGTGAAASGDLKTRTGYAGSSGGTANTYTDREHFESAWTTLTETTATAFATLTHAASTAVGAEFLVLVEANDGTEYQAVTSRVRVSSVRKATGNTVSAVAVVGTDLPAVSSGTLTCTFTTTDGASAVTVKADCTSSLTQTTLRASFQAAANGPVTIAGL